MVEAASAIIKNNQNNILICQRSVNTKNANIWEFPGGKLEIGETLDECAIRECIEELNINTKIINVFTKTTYKYPDNEIAFTFFNAVMKDGNITANVHQRLKWIESRYLFDYIFCPADVEIVEKLRRISTWI